MSRYTFSLADKTDDSALRQRMREDIMEGNIALTFRREPCYFDGTGLQGESCKVIKCTDRTNNRIVGVATRSVLSAYVNGSVQPLGYLSDLRGDESNRGGTLLARGYSFLKKLHQQSDISLYYTMVLDGNHTALDLLTSGRAGLPLYRPMGKVHSPAIHLDRPRFHRHSTDIEIGNPTVAELPSVLALVNRRYSQHQFAPVYTPQDINTPRLFGLKREDIYVAFRDSKPIGCIACWDQQATRQIHIERYSAALRWIRPLYNLASNLLPVKPLPDIGGRLPFFYLAWIAIDNNDCRVFRDLLETIYEKRRHGPWQFFIAGLHEKHPLLAELGRFRHEQSAGHLFAVHWQQDQQAFDRLDNRIPHIEAGAL